MEKKEDQWTPPPGRDPLVSLLTTTEAAEIKRVEPVSVVRAIREGRLRSWRKKLKGHTLYLIPVRELDRWKPIQGRGRKRDGEEGE